MNPIAAQCEMNTLLLIYQIFSHLFGVGILFKTSVLAINRSITEGIHITVNINDEAILKSWNRNLLTTRCEAVNIAKPFHLAEFFYLYSSTNKCTGLKVIIWYMIDVNFYFLEQSFCVLWYLTLAHFIPCIYQHDSLGIFLMTRKTFIKCGWSTTTIKFYSASLSYSLSKWMLLLVYV